MNKIERYSNWCYIDRLDGTDLVDGETLIIKWPDGQFQQTKIVVQRESQSYQDHGHTGEIPVSTAYILAYHRGVQVKVPLVGLEAQRVIS